VDDFCPWNAGTWRVASGGVERTEAEADFRLDASALASVYLGGGTFEQLRWARRLDELRPGAVGRADALFRAERQPWSPELF